VHSPTALWRRQERGLRSREADADAEIAYLTLTRISRKDESQWMVPGFIDTQTGSGARMVAADDD